METIVNPQGVGKNYNKDEYKKAQAIGWEILSALKNKIEIGMNEKDGRAAYTETLKEFNVEKSWHPPKIRFGSNSTKSFREVSDEDYKIKDLDIFFLDLGPIINGYEADIGKSFILESGQTPRTSEKYILHQKIINDGEEIFNLTKKKFYYDKLKGPELYTFAEDQAQARGWLLVDEGANGHRVGDFPHHVFYKGNLRQFKAEIIPNLWILEIQLRSPDMAFGAFFEDVL